MPKKKRKKRCLPLCCSGAVSPLDDYNAPSPDELRHAGEANEVESCNSEDHPVCPKSPSFSASEIDVSTLDQIAIDSQDPAQDLNLSLALEPSSEIFLERQDTKLTSVAAEPENTGTPSRYAQLGTGLPPVDEVERSLDADFDVSAAPAPEPAPAPAPYPPATRSSESECIPLDRPASSGSDCSSDADTRKTFWAEQDFRTERERSSTPRRPNRVLAMARERRVGLTRELFPSPPPKKKAVRRPVKMCTPDTSSSELSSDAEMYRLLGLEKPKSGKYKIDGVSLRRASAKTNLPSVFINNSDSLVDSQLSNSGSSTEPELCKLLDMSKSTDEDDSKPVDALKKGKPLRPVKHMRDLDSPPKVLIDNSPNETKFLKAVMNGSYRAKSPLAPIPTSHTEREEIPQDVSEFLPSKVMSTRGAFASAGSAIFQEEKNIHSLRIMGKPSQRSSDVRIRSFNKLDTRTSRGPDPVNTAETNRRIESVCLPTANPRPSLHPSPPDRKAPETGARSLSRFQHSRAPSNKVSEKSIESPRQTVDSQKPDSTTSGLRRPKEHQFMSFGKMSASVKPEETSVESAMVLDSGFGLGTSAIKDHQSSHRSGFGSYAPCPPVGKVADRHARSFNSIAPLPSTSNSVDKPPVARRQTGYEQAQSHKWQSPRGPKCTPEMLITRSNTKPAGVEDGLPHSVGYRRSTSKMENVHTSGSSSSERDVLSPRPAWELLKAGLETHAEVYSSSTNENRNSNLPLKPSSYAYITYPTSISSHYRPHQ